MTQKKRKENLGGLDTSQQRIFYRVQRKEKEGRQKKR